jgi:hypothetical protein
MNLWNLVGVRGAAAEAEGRRERAASLGAMEERLNAMMPTDPWGPFMSEQEIRLAGVVAPDDGILRIVQDTIRKRHMAVLVALYAWEPGMPHDALVEAASRVKELVELGKSLEEIVKKAGERERE